MLEVKKMKSARGKGVGINYEDVGENSLTLAWWGTNWKQWWATTSCSLPKQPKVGVLRTDHISDLGLACLGVACMEPRHCLRGPSILTDDEIAHNVSFLCISVYGISQFGDRLGIPTYERYSV